jgi:hypothetical protein
MNDTVATEDLEQPAKCHERKARKSDRDPGCRTSSRPAFSVALRNTCYPSEIRNSLILLRPKSNAFQIRPLMRTKEHFR